MTAPRVLVAIPAHNEGATIRGVIGGVRRALPTGDLLVVDDGSGDDTYALLRGLDVSVARHLANLGYGRAVQTAIRYARRGGYDVLVTLDGDGQHDPAPLPSLLEAFEAGRFDLCVGSRYVGSRSYRGAPLGRRIGMRTFSTVVGRLTGQRVYDTTSGLRAIRSTLFPALDLGHFVDFHAEALVYLLRLGFRVGEYPIQVAERQHGVSMYSALSALKYPAKTSLMIVLGLVQAELARRRVA